MNKDCTFRDCHATDRVLLYNLPAVALERVLRDDVEGSSVQYRWGPNQSIPFGMLYSPLNRLIYEQVRGISC